MMNTIANAIYCLVLGSFTMICSSCDNQSRTPQAEVIILDLKSGDGISESIDLICEPTNWTQARFDSINTAINTLASAGGLNRKINADKKLWAKLFTSSASCLERKVDSIFRLPVYSDYAQMQKDLNYLQRYLHLYQKVGIDIDSVNPSLQKVSKLFAEYDERLKRSRYIFSQQPKFLEAYRQSYDETARMIKEDSQPHAYWSNYFSHNQEIVEGVNAFPKRLSDSRYAYYSKLEKLIEEEALNENFSKEKLESVEDEFYNMAKDYNNNAINKLKSFRESYTPKTETISE